MKAIHKLSGQEVEIIKVYSGIVARCRITTPYHLDSRTLIDSIICLMENLEIIKP